MNNKYKQRLATFCAIFAALLYAISTPAAKILLKEIPPVMMAAFLYLGAGIGMTILGFLKNKIKKDHTELHLEKSDMPFIIGMVILDIAAPVFLMIGLAITTAANVSLLNNFEIAATSLIAFIIFKEPIKKRLWFAIILITLASIILSIQNKNSFSFSFGSVFVLLACICWGFENNCTKMLSKKDPLEIVIIKGFGSGIGSFIIALILKEKIIKTEYIIAALFLGFIAYGLSIFFYVYAQRELGAAKTSAYYAIAPFAGVAISFMIFQKLPPFSFFIALFLMILGTYLISIDSKIK